MSNLKRTSLKCIPLIALSGLLMANTKCQETAPEARRLKKNVRVIGMEASSFMDNSGFKFSEVAQNQLSGVLFETNHFFERNQYPTGTVMENFPTVQGIQKAVVMNSEASVQLKTWFPTLKTGEIQLTKESSCLISRPQHFVYGKINSLEAYSGASIQFGFNNNAVVPIPLSGNFKMDKMRMEISVHAFDPWTQQEMAAVNSEEFKKDYSAGFGIPLGPITIGPQFYRTTGMAEVTLKTLRKGVKDLANKLLSLDRQEWQTRVLMARDNYVVILGGSELGLKKGDKLKIENEVHDWIGAPCGDTSTLSGSVSVTNTPWIVEIEDAGNLMSKAKVLNIDENNSVNVGALVRIQELFVELPVTQTKK